GSNTVAVANGVRQELESMRAELPGNVKVNTLFDRSGGIEQVARDVKFTLLLTLVLVVLVIFLFLRNVSATLIPSLALPMSILGTFMVRDVLDYTIDSLFMVVLALAVGFIVDDAIVMLENIVRHMEEGKGRLEAALVGAREIGFTIVSMTASLAAVFLPVLFMGGIVGRLLHEVAVVIGAAVIVSGIVSLTLTPMASSRFLRPPHESHGRIYVASERVFDGMLALYRRTLQLVLHHPQFTLMIFFATVLLTGYLFYVVPKGFIPNEDTGQVFAFTEASQDISFEGMMDHQLKAAAIVGQQPYVKQFFS